MATGIVPQVPQHTTDFVPEVFGRLTTLDAGYLVDFGTYKKKCHMTRCDCGTVKQIRREKLLSGHTRSCGCLHKETGADRNRTHGKSSTGEYTIWRLMHDRCYNEKNPQHKDWGGRGIYIVEEWKGPGKFTNFLDNMGTRPSKKHSINRIDNDGPYSPENCRWATVDEQANNRTDNHCITWNGTTKTVAQWKQATGIHEQTIISRLRRGWTVEDALSMPPRPMKKQEPKPKIG